MAPIGTELKAFASLDETAALFQEKIDRLRGEIGALQAESGRQQVEVDKRREAVERLDKEIAAKQQRLDQLTSKVESGEAALADHKARIEKSLNEREAKAVARIEAADAAEAKLASVKQAIAQAQSRVDGLKADLLKAGQVLVTEAQKAQVAVEKALS